MTCYNHPELQAAGFCRECGRALCANCQRPANGTIFCQDHAPVAAAYQAPPATPVTASVANPYLQSAPPNPGLATSPGLAFALGLIPGVGAIYNGQYLKGLIHVFIFGLLISLIVASHEGPQIPMISLMLMGFYFYMAFEAFHTAKKRRAGLPVDEWSSLGSPSRYASSAPIGAALLIAIGVLFLLDNLGVFQFQDLARFWPVLLIVAGIAMLYNRLSGVRRVSALQEPVEHPMAESTRE